MRYVESIIQRKPTERWLCVVVATSVLANAQLDHEKQLTLPDGPSVNGVKTHQNILAPNVPAHNQRDIISDATSIIRGRRISARKTQPDKHDESILSESSSDQKILDIQRDNQNDLIIPDAALTNGRRKILADVALMQLGYSCPEFSELVAILMKRAPTKLESKFQNFDKSELCTDDDESSSSELDEPPGPPKTRVLDEPPLQTQKLLQHKTSKLKDFAAGRKDKRRRKKRSKKRHSKGLARRARRLAKNKEEKELAEKLEALRRENEAFKRKVKMEELEKERKADEAAQKRLKRLQAGATSEMKSCLATNVLSTMTSNASSRFNSAANSSFNSAAASRFNTNAASAIAW
eukprot:Gregarina_sp_Poly_1__10663@NODE_802_length_6243_cov_119_277850_g585_i0_p3_GENE_NODE_802_length_6243_cov_119_277850_g585_i0NODE_802_length_6243_cov_119_277850_g585_i0_p3_ORF_typecomplete_len350_score64_94CAF1_p150/PF11600_8/0_027UPF0242/PF06785_11/0_11HAUS5/PF14817_6/1_3_NODE_802_length_6243_cov_119_277850_g585_i026703719